VRKMTSLPARKHLLADRGVLHPGAFADAVVFNPDTIADIATYAEPRQYPAGIEYVVVNGQIAVEEGRQTGARAGACSAAPERLMAYGPPPSSVIVIRARESDAKQDSPRP